MTSTKKLFGAHRLILDDIGYTDSFVIPAGHVITQVLAETKDAMLTGGSISIGSANSGVETASFSVTGLTTNVYEHQQFTVTVTEGEKETATLTVSGVVTADPGTDITVVGETVAVLKDDTAADVAAKIVTAVNLSQGWTATQGVDLDTDKVYIEAVAVGTGSVTWLDSNPASGISIAITTTNEGVDTPVGGTVTIAGKQLVLQNADVIDSETAATALVLAFGGADPDWELAAAGNTLSLIARSYGDKALQTIVIDAGLTGVAFSAVTTTTPGSAAPTAGDITIDNETVSLAEADLETVVKVATKIAAHSFTNWTVERDGAGLVFTALGEGAIGDLVVALDTATGVSFSAVTTVGSTNHAEIAQATALSNDAAGMVELTLVSDGNYALTAADKTAHINISFGELVDNVKLYVSFEKYI